MKRFLAFALALAMMLSLAACGNSNSGESSSTSESSSAETGSTETGSTGSEGEAVEGSNAKYYETINMDTSENAITDLVTWETQAREVESFNVLYSQQATDFYVSTNLFDGLLTNDNHGKLVANLATEWEHSDDGVTWTFHLRDDACWVDQAGEYKADLTAQDFITGLEWVLNAYKNQAANTSMPLEMIAGAQEYYDYTNEMTEEEAIALAPDNEKFLELVGIECPDDYTVVYTCTSGNTYFDTVATYACLYPASAAHIEELGVESFRGETPETMWYSGPYIITSYVNGNEKIFEPNHYWWGNDESTRFNSVTVKMVDSSDTAYQLYLTGDIDQCELTESALSTIYNAGESDPNYAYLSERMPTKYSYQIHFCYNKNNEDGTPDVNWNTAIANEAFRLSWYYGLDLTTFLARTNSINPMSCENNFYTMKGLVYTSDGTDYTELVRDALGLPENNGETPVRLDSAKAEEYKAQAIEELTAKGVTFPVEIDYYIASGNQSALDTANVLAQAFSQCLGDDYVTLNICTYTSSLSKEVRTPKLGSIYINGWGADFGDPVNYMGQETFGDDNAYYSAVYSCINDFYDGTTEAYSDELIATYEEYTQLVNDAKAITDDLDARYEAFAQAEAYYIQHALDIPCYYSVVWQLTCVNDYSCIYAMYGMQSRRYLNWETNKNGYTTEDYEAFAAEYNAEG